VELNHICKDRGYALRGNLAKIPTLSIFGNISATDKKNDRKKIVKVIEL
jgi:hypothetical protein